MTRINARILKTASGCWEWQGARDPRGYGRTHHFPDGKKRSCGAVHRIVWEALRGPIPKGMVIDHIACRNPPCCNPEHLRVVTPTVNAMENNESPIAAHAMKRACPKCGGEYTTIPNPTPKRKAWRVCVRCDAERIAEYSRRADVKRRHADSEARRRARLSKNAEWRASQREYFREYFVKNRKKILLQKRDYKRKRRAEARAREANRTDL